MRDGRAPLSFPVTIPEVAIDEGDYERGAEKEERSADVIAPVGFHAVERRGGVKREREAEKLEENAEAHAGLALEETAEGERGEISRDENDRRHERLLGLEELQHRR